MELRFAVSRRKRTIEGEAKLRKQHRIRERTISCQIVEPHLLCRWDRGLCGRRRTHRAEPLSVKSSQRLQREAYPEPRYAASMLSSTNHMPPNRHCSL
jgi:hypothetical protein